MMKPSHISIILLLASICSAADLLPNGGFEEPAAKPFLQPLPPKIREYYAGSADSPFQNWSFGGRWERGDYSVALSTEAHTGRQSCQITCNRKGRGGIAAAPVMLASGTPIRVSLWVKAKDAVGGRIFLNFEGSGGDGWDSKDLRTGTFDWTRFTKRATVPGKAGEQAVVVFLYTTCEGSVWINDVTVEALPANAPDDDDKPPVAKPIAEPADSVGYRVNVVSPLAKVFREDDFAAQIMTNIEIEAARNEYESAQVVVESPWRELKVRDVKLSVLTGPGGAVIPAAAMKWDRVEYAQTTIQPPYYAERGMAWYPDPLMPAGPFTVAKLSRTPVWITLKTPKDCPAGQYTGTVTIEPEQLKPAVLPIKLTVWDFALQDQSHLRTLTWLGGGVIRAFYGNDWSPEAERRHAQIVQRYEDMLLEHRLGPGGEVVVNPPKKDGKFDFTDIDAKLHRLIGGGMNAFIIGTAPNLRREKKTEYSPQFIADFTAMVKAYCDHLREKGWADMAYVYTYDEAPRDAWPEVKKIASAVKQAAPEARILQCLNEPEGVKALTGFVDVFDVYVAQYHKAGVAASQKNGAEVWLAVCCYPMDRPNLFLEYPLLDARVIPWICWKYGARGFEYWSPNSWGVNYQKKPNKWPQVPWVANTFGRYNGDGYLLYPGAEGRPYSSIRLEAMRDGLEDYEYLWTLKSAVASAERNGRTGAKIDDARKLLTLAELITDRGGYNLEPRQYVDFRRKIAAAIVGLKARI